MPNRNTLVELWDFLKVRRRWWLIPLIIAIMVAGILIVLGSSSLSPFIYALF